MDNLPGTRDPSAYNGTLEQAALPGTRNPGSYDSSSQIAQSAPQDVTNAQQELGKHEDAGLCLSFAQDMAGVPHQDATAIDNFNDYAGQGKAYTGTQGIQPGDFVYFENGGAGHVGIVSGFDNSGQPTFVSATDNGIQEMGINDWANYAGQTYVGFTNPYSQ